MEVQKVEVTNENKPFEMIGLFEDVLKAKNVDGSFSYVVINGDTTVPEQGESVHDYDEISYIIEGELEVEIDGGIQYVGAGDCTLIKKGTPHRSTNLSEQPCKIVCLLI